MGHNLFVKACRRRCHDGAFRVPGDDGGDHQWNSRLTRGLRMARTVCCLAAKVVVSTGSAIDSKLTEWCVQLNSDHSDHAGYGVSRGINVYRFLAIGLFYFLNGGAP